MLRDDGDEPEFYNEKMVVGRRRHICCECQFPIDKGELHLCANGKWDGEMTTYRRHQTCHEAALAFEHGRSPFGYVRSDLIETRPPKGHPARRAWAKTLWRFRRRRPKTDYLFV